jgi:hypothetical protein
MNKSKSMDFRIDYNKHLYRVTATPHHSSEKQKVASQFKITLDGYSMGYITCIADEWESNNIIDQNLIDLIGSYIQELYVLQQ